MAFAVVSLLVPAHLPGFIPPATSAMEFMSVSVKHVLLANITSPSVQSNARKSAQ